MDMPMKSHDHIPTYLEHVVVRWEVDRHDRAVASITTQRAGILLLHRHALGVLRIAVPGPASDQTMAVRTLNATGQSRVTLSLR